MYNSILVPTDGSDGTKKALEHAIEIATLSDATIHVLSVVDRRLYLAAGEEQKDELQDSLHEDAVTAVNEVATTVREADVECTTAVRDGVPYRCILDYADEHDVDAVVMGTHGRTGRDKLASLGSVTERVVQNTSRPVLVVSIGRE
ncbi:universal stress protein uspa-like protein [Halogeometricum borinquense DSM 11551]|uniref:Universal stress protein UspA-like protein n=2 Tax=Halogeometricum borinquense TaxID=60847 RepID=E4NQG3_HALBP|nr:universal stress protein [Halogeometricum borinquense]ADQ67836.1 universal stress protein UspA-like protein [Halogeometricum borinquense DSM 11551]ELY23482.1 universal stress protein uspa-like protein [Halogeometricum borinquense DSM 11551]RYJ14620.1 universal stress protein [Halogeometricum borinquense]